MSLQDLVTVNQLCKKNKAFKPGGVRGLIFHEDKNGLAECGAIIRIGRKIFIHEEKFYQWIVSQNGGVK